VGQLVSARASEKGRAGMRIEAKSGPFSISRCIQNFAAPRRRYLDMQHAIVLA
jgi:hypothetical protein